MFRTILAAAAMLVMSAAAAQAQAPATQFEDCITAYVDMDGFHNRTQATNTDVSRWNTVASLDRKGLATGLADFDTVDFLQRAAEVAKRAPKSMSMTMYMGSKEFGHNDRAWRFMQETVRAHDDALAGKPIYVEQEKLLNAVHGCDVAFGFMPVINPRSAADEAARIRRSVEVGKQQDAARAAGLSDVQCAVRFAVAAQSLPAGAGREEMMQRYQAVLQKVAAATPPGGAPQVQASMEREGQELSQLFQSKRMTTADLVVELNGCETRLGLPVSKFGP
jgi:hypothetical protein